MARPRRAIANNTISSNFYWFESMGNLVIFGDRANRTEIISWLSEKAQGSFVVIDETMSLISGAKFPEVGQYKMPYSQREINDNFAILFEKQSDAMALKLQFEWEK